MNGIDTYKNHQILLLDGPNIMPKDGNVTVDKIYVKQERVTKTLRKLHYHLPIPFKEWWYGEWKYNIKKYDVIILFDGVYGKEIFEYIKSKNKNCRIILYYINKTKENARNHPKVMEHSPCEIWSFDKSDCYKNTIHYNHYFYDAVIKKDNVQEKIFDCFFCGVDKGRLKQLIYLKGMLEICGYTNKFIVVKDKNKSYSEEHKKYLTNENIDYEKITNYIQQSQCIVDIVKDGQTSITLRPMEAMYYSKKLITNNKDIVNYDFYHKDNIFVLNMDRVEDLKVFMNKPYIPIAENIKNRYTCEAWLERFFVDD